MYDKNSRIKFDQHRSHCHLMDRFHPMSYLGTAFDVLEASTISNSVPAMFAHYLLKNDVSLTRLQQAISLCGKQVEELCCRYDQKTNRFFPISYTLDSMVQYVDEFDFSTWNVQADVQLKIQIKKEDTQIHMCIALSHIVSDGAGFKQFLYMLSKYYNNPTTSLPHNIRTLHNTMHPPIFKAKDKVPFYPLHLRRASSSDAYYILDRALDFTTLHTYAKTHGFTLNDVLLYGYIMALHRITKEDSITLPCPVDLRKFLTSPPACSITNFTGGYLIREDQLTSRHPFDVLTSIHKNMLINQQQNVDFNNIWSFHMLYTHVPVFLFRFFVNRLYKEQDVSYTNTGLWEAFKLQFEDNAILDFYITTRFREYPSFQVSISTFRTTIHLTCSGYGNAYTKHSIDHMLKCMEYYLKNLPNKS